MSCAPRKLSYLSRRNGIYYLRIRVPNDLIERVGRFEIRRSLGVARTNQARLLVATYAARVLETFEMIRMSTCSKAEAAQAIQVIFEDLSAETDKRHFSAPASDFDQEVEAQVVLSEEWEGKLQQAVESLNYEGDEAAQTIKLLDAKVAGFEKLAPSQQQDLIAGAMRALIEQQRLFRFRLNEQLLPYEPRDPLFKTQSEKVSVPRSLHDMNQRHSQKGGPKVGQLVAKYLEAKRKRCTSKTIKMMSAKLALMTDHLGSETHISDVCVDDIRGFRDGVLRLKKSYRGEVGGFLERQTEVAAGQISLKTASTTFKTIKTFWNWAVKESYIEASPVGNLAVDLSGHKKAKKARRPFSKNELKQLFSVPLFRGCRSRYRRFEVGDHIEKDAKYWIPILGYYTGARLGELVQLHIDDIILDHDIPHISINEDFGEGHFKHLKSDAAERTIPLHPDLVSLGFADFVGERVKRPSKDYRLFREVKFGEDGQASTVFSKWFAQLMDKSDLRDSGLVFHSFRHGVQDIYRSSLVPQYLIDAIFGHQGTQTSDGYSHDIGLKAKLDAMNAANWPIALPTIL